MKKRRRFTVSDIIIIAIIGMLILLISVATSNAKSAPQWRTTTATWYGPGYYGNTTACGQEYSIVIKGIAHPSLPCGTRVSIKKDGLTVRTTVIDSCPACFDLSAKTAMLLCKCSKPYTMTVRWTRGWYYRLTPRPKAEVL